MTLSREEQDWIERECGGRIVDIEQQARWRVQHFVTLETPDGELKILARSARDAETLAKSKLMQKFSIRHEALVIEALQGYGLKIPKFYAFSEEFQTILMEQVAGSPDMTLVKDEATRVDLMKQYYEQLALLHSLDIEPLLKTVTDTTIPATNEEIAFKAKFGFQERPYLESRAKLRPEPLLDLGLWWLHANVPQGDRQLSWIQGDTGPGQLLYADGKVTALIDWELSHVGDPMLDLGVGRMRNMLYPTCSLAGPMQHYEQVSGRKIDREALRFYTVISMMHTPLGTSMAVQRMTARNADMLPRMGWDATLRRGLCDALAENESIELDPPELPDPPDTGIPTIVDLLVEQLELNCTPIARDKVERYQLEQAIATARTVQLESRIGAKLLADDLDDMGAVLGRRPRDRQEGLEKLSEIVDIDPASRLDELVWLFARIERRREYLWLPLMIDQKSAPYEPLAPQGGAARRRVEVGA